MRELIDNGYLYIAQPPLFGIKKGKKILYVKDQPALDRFLTESGIEGRPFRVQSSKGPGVEWHATLFNLATRLKSLRAILNEDRSAL